MDNTISSNLVCQIIELIKKEKRLYIDFIYLLEKKQKAIIAGDVKSLERYSNEERNLSKLIIETVKTADMFVNKFCDINSIDNTVSKFKTLLRTIPASFSVQLEKLRDEVIEMMNRITKMNKENEHLLKSSLSFVQEMIHLIVRAGEEPVDVYGLNSDVIRKGTRKRVLDYQV